jgi:hypothetical protein
VVGKTSTTKDTKVREGKTKRELKRLRESVFRLQNSPRRLEAALILRSNGTSELVPFPKSLRVEVFRSSEGLNAGLLLHNK